MLKSGGSVLYARARTHDPTMATRRKNPRRETFAAIVVALSIVGVAAVVLTTYGCETTMKTVWHLMTTQRPIRTIEP